MCRHITVSHNSIYDTPRAGINVSEGTWGGHIIEFNDVFDTVKETGDHGSFNSWGRDRFWHPHRQVMDSLVNAEASLILADVDIIVFAATEVGTLTWTTAPVITTFITICV